MFFIIKIVFYLYANDVAESLSFKLRQKSIVDTPKKLIYAGHHSKSITSFLLLLLPKMDAARMRSKKHIIFIIFTR